MKRIAQLIALLMLGTVAGSAATHYINQTTGGTATQCTGLSNTPYVSGTGQPCPLKHPYYLMVYSGAWASLAPGDTIQFTDDPSTPHTYYLGEQNGGLGFDWGGSGASGPLGGICPPPNSGHAAGASCVLPVLPDGVNFIGQNAGNCHYPFPGGLKNPTILSGLSGVFALLNVQGTNHVTISCIELTEPDTCHAPVASSVVGHCLDLSNFVATAGLILAYNSGGIFPQGPSNLTLQDFSAVGLASQGILGSHLNTTGSDFLNASEIYIVGNAGAGWNGDGGGCNNSCETVGLMNLDHVDVEWNGCNAVTPYTTTIGGNGFTNCYGASDGGYGDGFVQVAAANMTLNVTRSRFAYNTQDGFDALHLSDDVTTSPRVNISTSWSEGNGGQTFKIGAGATSTAINNMSISNCHILAASTSPDIAALAKYNNPSGWISLDYGDTCRASGDQWSFQLNNGSQLTIENNTTVGYGTTMYEVGCAGTTTCVAGGASVVFKNNLSMGFPDPGNAGRLASGWFFGSDNVSPSVADLFANVGSVSDHNLWFNMRTLCPNNTTPSETNAVCADPLLVAESDINEINPNLTGSSPAIGAGITISGITTDYNGTTRPSPPSIGAFELLGAAGGTVISGSGVVSGTVTY